MACLVVQTEVVHPRALEHGCRGREDALPPLGSLLAGFSLALAEDSDTVMVSADGKLLRALKGTRYASLARPLEQIGNLL